ncbi:MAG: response regulator transcription factor [Myxococcales bacterium]
MISPSRPSSLQVLLVEDHPAVREGLALVLGQKGIALAAYASTAAEAVAALASNELLQAAIVDLSLEQGSGLEAIAQLCVRRPELPIVVYSMHEEPARIREALDCGAGGYVTKRDAVECLAEGVLAVLVGRRYLSPRAAESLAHSSTPAAAESLPPQERRIFLLIGEGCGINEIAEQLSLSARTIESYCERIQSRLGVTGMRELRRCAIQARRG